MDDQKPQNHRHMDIREGAGREESRISQDFLDLLNKWSFPLLILIAVVAGGYVGLRHLEQRRHHNLGEAWQQLDAAVEARNPASLERIAEEWSGTGAVAPLARLRAADLRLEAYRTGLPAGTAIDPLTGSLPEGIEPLGDEARKEELAKAEALYRTAFEGTKDEASQVVLTLGALNGLAAVAESRGEAEQARQHYQQVIDRASAAGMNEAAELARTMAASVDELAQPGRLYAQAELPQAPTPPQPAGAPNMSSLQGMVINGPDGRPMTVNAQGQLVPVDDPSAQAPIAPAPAPEPAPAPQP